MKLRTVRCLKAFALFEQKKYDESMDLFSSVSATPRIVISLFPPVIAGDLSEHDNDPSEAYKTTEAENGTPTPVIASAIPDSLRANLEQSTKDIESDASSILSKHTETSAGPIGTPARIAHDRRERSDSRDVGFGAIFSRHALQIISLAKS